MEFSSVMISDLLPFFVLILTTTDGQVYRDGDVRLVGGSYQWEGRVEVYMSGVWGTISDSDWTDEDAAVVCRKLGHFRPGSTSHSGAYFGEGRGAVNLDSVHCNGSEYILTDCQIDISGMRTSHSLDVGVKCQPAEGSYREGDIRLVEGPTDWEGRMDIFWNGTWGTIIDSQWTVSDARVVCRQLQHAAGSGEAISIRGGNGHIHIDSVTCSGTEQNITMCDYSNATLQLGHNQDVGVRCHQGNEAREGEIRLSSRFVRKNLWFGRVEILLFGEWGTVCNGASYDYRAAMVLCRQLGYHTYGSLSRCCWFGQGSGPIHYVHPYCTGSEYRLNNCVNRTASSCSHSLDWAVRCSIDGPEPLDIRLSYRLEAFISGSWLPVGDSDQVWSTKNSKVACRQLGYDAKGTDFSRSYYSTSRARMDNVNCSGMESQLKYCYHNVSSTARTIEVVLKCEMYEDIRLVGGDSEREGRVEVCRSRRWGTVCGTQWTEKHTAVVCRFLGFSEFSVAYYSFKKYGRGTGPVFIDYINCTGGEWSLWGSCTRFTHYYGCSHDDDIGVQCKPAQCFDGQLRLAAGSDTYYGRVEICSDQRWNTFSSMLWSPSNAMVACIEIGFQRHTSASESYGKSGGPRYSKFFQCSGSVLRLSNCLSFNYVYSRSYGHDIGIVCTEADCANGQIRLMEGEGEWEGRLEVCYNKRWGTVGGDDWTETNSNVVCNALGYDKLGQSPNQSIPMAHSKPLYYHSIKCSIRDQLLLECGYSRYTDFTKTFPHAIVKCQESVCEDGDVRLVGGATEREGRLEVCFGRRWGTIDGHGWTHIDTQVACRQLGHSAANVSYSKLERTKHVATQSLPVFMTLVGCYGTEHNLTDCSYHEFEFATTSSIDVGISCGLKDISSSHTNSDGNGDTGAQADGVLYASLSITVILAIVVVIMVAVLTVLWLKKKKSGQSSPAGVYFSNKDETVSLENMLEGKIFPEEGYEEVKTPQTSLSSKMQPKHPFQIVGASGYTQDANNRSNAGTKTGAAYSRRPPTQQQEQRPPSEAIYECFD